MIIPATARGISFTLNLLPQPGDDFSLAPTSPMASLLPKEVYLYIEDVYVSPNELITEPVFYWSLDPDMASDRERSVILDLLGVPIREERRIWRIMICFSWNSEIYKTLGENHRDSGIDPNSDDAAGKFGLPLVKVLSELIPGHLQRE